MHDTPYKPTSFKLLKALFSGFGGEHLFGIILGGIFTAGVGTPIFGMLGAALGLYMGYNS